MPMPARQDLAIYKGDTVTVVIRLWTDTAHTVPFPITDTMLITSQMRTGPGQSPAVDFTVSAPVGGNEVTLTLPPAQSALLPDSGQWDVQIDHNGDGLMVQTVAAGNVTVTDDITRAGTLRAKQRV